ncbi:hypothetical protein GCM10010211_44400 [Streptomyces albospinus]|uniref:Chaplin domain-containing protein n=1 Tax=Streptomyces albospinus TaxID=285515 RepID=A0ABQ2V9Y8_9ACTN|nr:chaplin [Streptomyces albospinus]GGU73554.1 hypothetical protein GCM10010211_44400 [Streptomyces albospinus]
MSARTVFTAGALIAAALLTGAGTAAADTGPDAAGVAAFSPGIGSGNQVQLPLHVPVNATGNSGNVIGAFNPAFANESSDS